MSAHGSNRARRHVRDVRLDARPVASTVPTTEQAKRKEADPYADQK